MSAGPTLHERLMQLIRPVGSLLSRMKGPPPTPGPGFLDHAYQRELQRLPSSATADQRDLGLVRAMERCRARRTPLSIGEIERWLGAFHNQPLKHYQARALFDLGTGPVVFDRGETLDHGDRVAVQSVFLTKAWSPQAIQYQGQQLDLFADEMAWAEGFDGVVCLGGVRGSGKSTVLNRIARACETGPLTRHVKREGRWPPLVVRVDMSTAFKQEAFVRDLVEQLGREARRHFERHAGVRLLTQICLFVGNAATFARANIGWSAMALIVLMSLIGIARVYEDPDARSAAREKAAEVERLKRHQAVELAWMQLREERERAPKPIVPPLLPAPAPGPTEAEKAFADAMAALKQSAAKEAAAKLSPYRHGDLELPIAGKQRFADLQLLALCLGGLLVLGVVHAGLQALQRSRVPWRRPAAGLWAVLPSLRALGVVPPLCAAIVVLLAGAAFYDWLRSLVAPAPQAGIIPTLLGYAGLGSDPLVVPFVLSLGLAVTAVLMLPDWWHHYEHFRRSGRAQRSADAPPANLPVLGGFLMQLLPRADDPEQLDQLSLPFVQVRARMLLERAAHVFGRVVILIDDADMLPSDSFHDLLRALRPLSKVRGVRCVVATPMFFYDALRTPALSDVHSTVRDCLVLGDPDVFEAADKGFALKQPIEPVLLRSKLVRLLISRLRVPVFGTIDDVSKSPLWDQLLARWNLGAAALDADVVAFLEAFGTSRRELLRVLARPTDSLALDAPRRTQIDFAESLERRKLEYARHETLLQAARS